MNAGLIRTFTDLYHDLKAEDVASSTAWAKSPR